MFLPVEHLPELVIPGKFHRIDDILGIKIIGRVPTQLEHAVLEGGRTNVKRHGVIVALRVLLIIFLNFLRQCLRHRIILRSCKGQMLHVRHLPDVLLGDGAVMRRHLLDPVGIQIIMQFLYCGIQYLPIARGLKAAAEQHIAPVVADAPLPAFSICKADQFAFFTAKHAIVIPVQNVPCIRVLRTVKIHVAALGIGIARQ